MFGRSSSTVKDPGDVVDQQDNTMVDEPTVEQRENHAARVGAEQQADADRTGRIMTRPSLRRKNMAQPTPATEPYPTTRPDLVNEPEATEAELEPARWAHVSFVASVSVVLGTLAVAATLTGLLAPFGFVAGILAVLFGLLAMPAVRRRNVTGHGLVGFGILLGLAAIVLSMVAMSHQVSWLSSRTDEVATVHTWLTSHMHWLRRW